MKADATLDTLGFYCPVPLLKTSEKMKELKVGQVLMVLSDDREVLYDFPAWCKSTGNRVLKVAEEKGEYRLYIQKMVE